VPDVAVNVTACVAAAAVRAAVNVVLCATPGVRFKVAGLAVTPVGNPVIATATAPLRELTAVAVMLTGEPAAPAMIVKDVGLSASVKSGATATVRATAAE
jgi:hypothetical protein